MISPCFRDPPILRDVKKNKVRSGAEDRAFLLQQKTLSLLIQVGLDNLRAATSDYLPKVLQLQTCVCNIHDSRSCQSLINLVSVSFTLNTDEPMPSLIVLGQEYLGTTKVKLMNWGGGLPGVSAKFAHYETTKKRNMIY